MGRVLHASYSGYFPFCLAEYQDEGFGTSVCDLTSAMKAWWRMKKVRFYGTYGIPDLAPEQYYDWELIAQRNAATEENLVCNPDPSWNIVSYKNLEASPVFYTGYAYKKGGNYLLDVVANGKFKNTSSETGFWFGTIYDQNIAYQSLDFGGITLFGPDPVLSSSSGTTNFEVLEWWSYGGTYDTETGESV